MTHPSPVAVAVDERPMHEHCPCAGRVQSAVAHQGSGEEQGGVQPGGQGLH